MEQKKSKKERDLELNPINQRIAMYRKRARLNQDEVAEMLDMKPKTYSRMERYGKISGEMVKTLARIFEVPAVWILEGDEDKYGTHAVKEPTVPLKNSQPHLIPETPKSPKKSTSAYIARMYDELPSDLQFKVFDFVNKVFNEAKDRKKKD